MSKELELPLAPWARPPEELFANLASSQGGLSEEEAAARQARFGRNEFSRSRGPGIMGIALAQIASPLVFVLGGAALITIVLDEWVETVVILLAILLNAALGFFQEYRAEHTVEHLTSYIKHRTRVVREGREYEIDSSALVPGDIIRLSFGSRVPADARVLAATDLSTDESFLTGESQPVEKLPDAVSEGAPVTGRTSMVFAGSLVMEGYGEAVVTEIGERTEIGRIARLVELSSGTDTPLQKAMRSLAWVILAGVSVIIAALFFLGLSRGVPVLEMLLLSAATAVGAVPEALPIVLTVILAIGVERIAAKKGILRSLAAAETLGSTTVVMTDKTGTLTEAKMQITSIMSVADILAGKTDAQALKRFSDQQKELLTEAFLGTEAVLENPEASEEERRFVGRPLEANIAREASRAGVDIVGLAAKRETVLPFNSTDKFSVGRSIRGHGYALLGAPDVLMRKAAMTKDTYVALENFIQTKSEEGKRLLGIGRLAGDEKGKITRETINEIEFLGVLELFDPLREEAPAAVKRIESHGARVVMITGDLKGTALSIAKALGWEVGEGEVMTGEELRQIPDAELKARLSHIRIFARVTPEDKLRVGQLYRASGEVVAMTGDGVNDAPSLKAADIGIALGSGSDVAKSAADLVLLDDNFRTIVLAIEEGRRIVANIRKSFVYLMSNSLDEVFLLGGSLLFALPLPLTAMQIIWVNFFTGSLPALAYALEENRDIGKTRGRERIFSGDVRLLTLGIGVASSVFLFALYYALVRYGLDIAVARTVLFTCFASYILVIAYSFKSLHQPLFTYPLFDNRALNVSVGLAAAFIAASVVLPITREWLGLSPLPLPALGLVAAWLVLNIALIEAAKWGYRLASRP